MVIFCRVPIVKKYFRKTIDNCGFWSYIYIMRQRKDDFRLIVLAEYINRTGVRIQAVADKIGVTNRTIYNWLADPASRVSPLAGRRLDLYLRLVSRAAEELENIKKGGKK